MCPIFFREYQKYAFLNKSNELNRFLAGIVRLEFDSVRLLTLGVLL